MSGILTQVTEQRWMQRETSLAEQVGEIALASSSIEVESAENLVVRDILPAQDLNSGEDNGWSDDTEDNPSEEWRQDWGTDGTADEYNHAYSIDSGGLNEDKAIGFMGLTVLHSDNTTRQLRFEAGQGGNQGVKREFNIESLETAEESRAMFLQPVLYDAKEHGLVDFYQSEVSDGDRVILHGYVAEAVGETLSEPSSPQLAQQGGM